MKTSKSLLYKLLLLFLFFLEVQYSQYFLQQILNFKLFFVFYLKISLLLLFLPSTIGCNNLVLSISYKSIVKNIVNVAFFFIFYLFFI